MSLKAWLYGLFSGVIASAASAGSAALGAMAFAPELLRNGHFWEVIAGTAVFAGFKTAMAWLAKSPLPAMLTTTTTTTSTTTSTDPPPATPVAPVAQAAPVAPAPAATPEPPRRLPWMRQ
jgi:hypothetical protein